MAITVEHPGHGAVKMLGFPIKFTTAPCTVRRPAPDLGADTEAILQGLGYLSDEITRLRNVGAV